MSGRFAAALILLILFLAPICAGSLVWGIHENAARADVSKVGADLAKTQADHLAVYLKCSEARRLRYISDESSWFRGLHQLDADLAAGKISALQWRLARVGVGDKRLVGLDRSVREFCIL